MWLMHGFFKVNGGCGYIKKPEFLLKNEPNNGNFDPKAKLPVKKTLKVSFLPFLKLLSSFWLSKFSVV